MELTLEEIKARLKAPQKAGIIAKAFKHENRLRFHVESYVDPSEIAQPLTDFLDWVRTLIPKDKFNIFVSLFKFPIPTVKLTTSIFSELERVFDGKNPASNFKFSETSYREDWEEYRKEELKEPQVWRKKGWDAMKTAINSVLVVDLPAEQIGQAPAPYFYFLDIQNVLDFDYKDDAITAILFKQSGNRLAAYDDVSYKVFQLNDDDDVIIEELINETHELGYCPAQFFWSTELNQKAPVVKKSPLSAHLANLDWLLFFGISKRHLDLYAPYPIYSAYAADCDFQNNETGDYCDGGYLRDASAVYKVFRDGTIDPCPVCSDKRVAGVGSFIEVPVPTKEEPDMREPVTITTVDRDSLDYNVEEVQRIAEDIFSSVVGIGGSVEQKESINEMQVTANFESRSSVLNNLKANLETARKFVDDTICTLRYGDNFLGSSLSMGTEFYIYSVANLYEQFAQAKKNGASDSELDAISDQILTTEYRNNPTQLQRMLVLKQLEPYRHYTFDEILKLHDKELIAKDLLKVKINFSTFVDRFERENTNIVEFGSQLDFNTKIDIITKKMLEYGTH